MLLCSVCGAIGGSVFLIDRGSNTCRLSLVPMQARRFRDSWSLLRFADGGRENYTCAVSATLDAREGSEFGCVRKSAPKLLGTSTTSNHRGLKFGQTHPLLFHALV